MSELIDLFAEPEREDWPFGDLPAGEFRVIVADPPWRYSNTGNHGTAEKHYPTMTPKELRALPVADLCRAEGAVLFLWITFPQLAVGMDILKAWGFKHKTGLPWVKLQGKMKPGETREPPWRPAMGTGFWIRACAELVLIATRGKVKPPPREKVQLGLLSPRFEHSRKPDGIFEIAETLPGPYCELFARRRRPKWHCHGLELEDAEIPGS